jgi:F-type H+-transporting ATPase subunit b
LNQRSFSSGDRDSGVLRPSRTRVFLAALAVACIMGWLPSSTPLHAQQPTAHSAATAEQPKTDVPPAAGAEPKPADATGTAPAEHKAEGATAEHGAATEHGAAGEHGAEGEGEGEQKDSILSMVARAFNFAILAGALVYLLRSPIASYLEQRGVTIRSDLKKAADLRDEASGQIAAIEAKLQALPEEIDALKRRGADEIAAEEARIRDAAAAERQRMLDQAKREIDTQLRVAERDLKRRAGELAVTVATERVKRTITPQDQTRLVDRYTAQVRN